MRITYRVRIKRGWGEFVEDKEELTPARVVKAIADMRAKCNGKHAFDVTKPGDRVPVTYSGNVGEMIEVHNLLGEEWK